MQAVKKSKAALSGTELLAARVHQLIDDAYAAGQRDAASAIMKIVGKLPTRDGDMSRQMQALFSNAVGNAETKRARAPRGTSRSLVERVLARGAFTAKEVAAQAKTPEEKLLTFSAVYLELVRGLQARRYKRNGSKWHISKA